jgi:pimeloyl-ACP methyl ester carboxylesterase
VYIYDRRGSGDSGDSQPYAIEREYEDLQAMIDEAGGSAFVWGLSSGAVLALQAAARGQTLRNWLCTNQANTKKSNASVQALLAGG